MNLNYRIMLLNSKYTDHSRFELKSSEKRHPAVSLELQFAKMFSIVRIYISYSEQILNATLKLWQMQTIQMVPYVMEPDYSVLKDFLESNMHPD